MNNLKRKSKIAVALACMIWICLTVILLSQDAAKRTVVHSMKASEKIRSAECDLDAVKKSFSKFVADVPKGLALPTMENIKRRAVKVDRKYEINVGKNNLVVAPCEEISADFKDWLVTHVDAKQESHAKPGGIDYFGEGK